MSRVGNRLASYRAAHRLSWRQLGRQLGHSSTYVQDLARGRRRATVAAAQRYASLLGEDEETWIVDALDDKLDAHGHHSPPGS